MISQKGSDFAKSCHILMLSIPDHDILAVRLDIGGDCAGPHVCIEAKDGIPYIVIVRNLHVVEQYDILQFRRIADRRVLADDRTSADESTLADLRIPADDRRSVNISAVKDDGAFVNPDILSVLPVRVFLRVQRFPELENKIPDLRENLPRIGCPLKKVLCNGLIEIIEFFNPARFHPC